MPSVLTTKYVCQQCGAESPKWQGRCYECGAWNSLVEVAMPKKRSSSTTATARVSLLEPQTLSQIALEAVNRFPTGFTELDRVLGGGVVPGSVVLIGGEPGIGKSTLLLQVLLHTGGLYISAEESAHQVKLRADRLGGEQAEVKLLATNQLEQALATIESTHPAPPLVIVDSIQTIASSQLEGVPGSVGQVRECTNQFVQLAKQRNIPILLVGHVTKEGTIAGPKVLEHVVDAVLYLEGDELNMTRLVRGIKNRFGPVNEVGVFELSEQGMTEVLDTSQIFVPDQSIHSGSAVTVTMEGIRPMLVEIQALTTPTSFGLPRRTANGMDYNRLLMLIAVLTKRTKLNLGNQDIYTNVAGGMKLREPALDLAVCLALVSSLKDRPLPSHTAIFGEVSLAGEIKPVLGQQKRLEQAKKLGYNSYITPDTAKTLAQALSQAWPGRE